MNKEKLMILTLSALALAACSSGSDSTESESPEVEQSMEIRLSTGLEMQTRAYTPTQSTAVADGQTIYAWADDHVNKTNSSDHTGDIVDYLKGWTLTSSGASLTGSKQYYSAAGNNLDVYAVHGTFNNTVTEGTTSWTTFSTGLTHTVAAAQNTGTAYLDSDLLYAVGLNLARQSTPHTLTFKHLLSKIEIYVVMGGGLSVADITGATLTIQSMLPTAGVTLNKSDAASSVITASGTPADVSPKVTTSTTETVTIGTEVKQAPLFAEAIIVPQKYDTNRDGTGTGMHLIKIVLPNGTSLETPIGTYSFEQGKRYAYNLTVNAKEIRLQGEITDWTGDPAIAIDAY